MVRNFPRGKQIAETISERFGCNWHDLGQIVSALSDTEYKNALEGILPDDISERLQAQGIQIVSGISGKVNAKSEQKAPARKSEPKQERKTAKRTTERKRLETNPTELCTPLQRVSDADIIPTGINSEGLPADFADRMEQWFEDFAKRYDLELTKVSPQQWHSACMYVGERINKSGALRNNERIKIHGGNSFDGKALLDFVNLWEYFTGIYKHLPLTRDFISMAGMSPEAFFDSQGHGLTSTQIDLRQKVRAIVEGGIEGGLLDGHENPTGKIFYSKARLGWQEAPQLVQVNHAPTESAGALPVFNPVSGALEDKTP